MSPSSWKTSIQDNNPGGLGGRQARTRHRKIRSPSDPHRLAPDAHQSSSCRASLCRRRVCDARSACFGRFSYCAWRDDCCPTGDALPGPRVPRAMLAASASSLAPGVAPHLCLNSVLEFSLLSPQIQFACSEARKTRDPITYFASSQALPSALSQEALHTESGSCLRMKISRPSFAHSMWAARPGGGARDDGRRCCSGHVGCKGRASGAAGSRSGKQRRRRRRNSGRCNGNEEDDDSGNQQPEMMGWASRTLLWWLWTPHRTSTLFPSPHLPHQKSQDSPLRFGFIFPLGEQKLESVGSDPIWGSTEQ